MNSRTLHAEATGCKCVFHNFVLTSRPWNSATFHFKCYSLMMFNDVFVLIIFVSYGESCWLEGLGCTTEPSELVKPFFSARPMTLELLRLHQARQGFVCVNF